MVNRASNDIPFAKLTSLPPPLNSAAFNITKLVNKFINNEVSALDWAGLRNTILKHELKIPYSADNISMDQGDRTIDALAEEVKEYIHAAFSAVLPDLKANLVKTMTEMEKPVGFMFNMYYAPTNGDNSDSLFALVLTVDITKQGKFNCKSTGVVVVVPDDFKM